MLDQCRGFVLRRRRIVIDGGATAASTRSGRTSLAHLQAIAARGDTRGDEETSRAFPASKEPKYGRQVSMARPCPTVGRRTGGATMNKAVMKLPLMLGVVGAIAFAAATPSWAAEQKGPNAAAGANLQAGAPAKANRPRPQRAAGPHSRRKTPGGRPPRPPAHAPHPRPHV